MFKYYKIDGEILESLIGNNPSIRSCSPARYNDPNELKFNLEIDPNSIEVERQYFKDHPSHNAEDFIVWKSGINENYIWYTKNVVREGVSKSVNLICFSNSGNSNLLWSHYADSHKGICIEYNMHLFADLIESRKFGFIQKVEYVSDPPVIKWGFDNEKDCVMKALFFKQKEWSYEKEIRICFDSERNSEIINIKKENIISVIIGSRTEIEHRNKIVELCKLNNYNLLEASNMTRDYDLNLSKYKSNVTIMRSFY